MTVLACCAPTNKIKTTSRKIGLVWSVGRKSLKGVLHLPTFSMALKA